MRRHASEESSRDKIILWREDLNEVPQFTLPASFSLRWYQPGDDQEWFRIQTAADRINEITPDLFARQFGDEDRVLAQRQCYLLSPTGRAIGTATAWFNENFHGHRFGRVHWVAILPEFQGRGLSKPLMSTVCQRLRKLGHDRAYLSTSTARLGAIRLYLKFGFAPLITNPIESALWQSVEDKMPAEDRRNFFGPSQSNK